MTEPINALKVSISAEEEQMEALFQAEDEIMARDITFDTGYNIKAKQRDWFFDTAEGMHIMEDKNNYIIHFKNVDAQLAKDVTNLLDGVGYAIQQDGNKVTFGKNNTKIRVVKRNE